MNCIPIVADAPARSSILVIRSLAKSFFRGPASAPTRTTALVDVNLDLESGELLGIVGAAGTGKTTLLQCAAGILRRDRGLISWFGEPFAGGGRLPNLAYVPSMPVYYPFLTVRDVLEYRFAQEDLPLSFRNESIASALTRVELDCDSSAYVCDLPRGAIQRLALAEALVADRSVVFLDTSSSDVTAQCESIILQVLAEEASNGRAVVVAVRDAGVVAAVASRILLLEDGRNAGNFVSEAQRPRTVPATSFGLLETRDRIVAERLH